MYEGSPEFTLEKGRGFIEINRDGELVARVKYVKIGRTVVVQGLTKYSTRSKTLQEFVNAFGVPPGKYLLEELVRQGATRFRYGVLSKNGKRILDLAEKGRLIKKNRFLSYLGLEKAKLTPKGIASAKSRKHVLR